MSVTHSTLACVICVSPLHHRHSAPITTSSPDTVRLDTQSNGNISVQPVCTHEKMGYYHDSFTLSLYRASTTCKRSRGIYIWYGYSCILLHTVAVYSMVSGCHNCLKAHCKSFGATSRFVNLSFQLQYNSFRITRALG